MAGIVALAELGRTASVDGRAIGSCGSPDSGRRAPTRAAFKLHAFSPNDSRGRIGYLTLYHTE